jgi:hypothetical protein
MSNKENDNDLGRIIKDGYSVPEPTTRFVESLGKALGQELGSWLKSTPRSTRISEEGKGSRMTWLRALISNRKRKVAFACCTALILVTAAWGAGKLFKTVTQTIERFRSAVVQGRDSDAVKLTDPRSAVARQLDEWRELEKMNPQGIQIVSVYASGSAAFAITTEIVADHDREGPLVITLVKHAGNWVLKDIDVETAETAQEDLELFLEKHPDAVEISGSQETAEWGKPKVGVQARLRADKRVWQERQVVSFKADIRNGGKARLRVVPTHQRCFLILDGRDHYWPTWEWVESQSFPPGKFYRDIPISLVETWAGGTSLGLAPGRHKASVRFQCQGTGDQGQTVIVDVETNTVEFEIQAAPPE